MTQWKLFLDDLREPPDNSYIVARSSQEAIDLVEKLGLPIFMSLM